VKAMVVSMTGFGRSKSESGPISVTVEIKTVNHRFSEYYFRMPRQLLKMEEKIKKILNHHIRRGRIEVFVTLEGERTVKRKIDVDWEILEDYYQFIKSAQEKFSIQESIKIQDLLNLDGLIHIEESEAGNEELENLLLKVVDEAAIQLRQMRSVEGLELEKDVTAHLLRLETFVTELRNEAPTVIKQYEERMTKRMQDFLNGQIDEVRLLTEVAVFAEKADINEELTRLSSHIQQFLLTMKQAEPIGRKLDFVLQEMNREVNTIGSKANDSNIAKRVVEMKSLLEKMKEQVQNIE
jgi:uncharacterized protein (TIGR00255 family)